MRMFLMGTQAVDYACRSNTLGCDTDHISMFGAPTDRREILLSADCRCIRPQGRLSEVYIRMSGLDLRNMLRPH